MKFIKQRKLFWQYAKDLSEKSRRQNELTNLSALFDGEK
jgi:hypothetical protein